MWWKIPSLIANKGKLNVSTTKGKIQKETCTNHGQNKTEGNKNLQILFVNSNLENFFKNVGMDFPKYISIHCIFTVYSLCIHVRFQVSRLSFAKGSVKGREGWVGKVSAAFLFLFNSQVLGQRMALIFVEMDCFFFKSV